MTEKQDYIIDHVGAENWEQVVAEFTGLTAFGIFYQLNTMFPNDDNRALAQAIHDELT